MKKNLIIVCAAVFFAACSGGSVTTKSVNGSNVSSPTAKSDKLTVKIGGVEKPFEIKKSVATVREDLRMLYILVANYDIDMTGKQGLSAPRTTAEGEVKILFGIENKTPGTDYKTPVPTGEYAKVTAYIERDGKPSSEYYFIKDTPKKITITSITNDTVTGFVEFAQGETSLNGKFEAKIIPD